MRIFSTISSLIVLLGAFVLISDAQTQRGKKTTKRSSNPAIRTMPSDSARIIEAEIVSTAEEIENQESGGQTPVNPSPIKREKTKQNASASQNPSNSSGSNAALQREIKTLRDQVKALSEKRGVDDLEKLSLAEERAENFRRKLEETIGREAELNAKIQQIEYQSRPEAIQIETAAIGSTRPEEVRDARRKMLEAEKTRLREQINQVQISRSRLEAAVLNADSLVEKLRARIEADFNSRDSKTVTAKDAEKKQPEPNDDEDSNPQF
jgi:chromosome segregation ATPase